MKTRGKFIGLMSVAAAVCLLASSAQAGWGGRGGWGWGYRGWGWGWGIPVGVSLAYTAPYYYYPPSYYSAPPVTYYSSPSTVVYSSPPPVSSYQQPAPQPADRPLPPTAAVRDSDSDSQPMQSPKPVRQNAPSQSLNLTDVKALVKAQIGDSIILSQIRNSHAVFHLTSNEIIDLKSSGVSEKVIEFMINTASGNR